MGCREAKPEVRENLGNRHYVLIEYCGGWGYY